MYASFEELTKRVSEQDLLEFTDDEQEGAFNFESPNPAYQRVLQAIADADAVIDARLRGRYPVPFNPVPSIITRISTVFTIHLLYGRKLNLEMTESMKTMYKVHKEILDQLQDGTQMLPGFESAGSKPPFIKSNKKPCDRYFSSDRMRAFRGSL
jgi:phage gp36-like protein